MKKNLLHFAILIFTSIACRAQFAPLTPPQTSKPKLVKTQTSPGLESTPTRTTPPQPTNTIYSLSSVKVTIKTGNDNKESLSNLSVELAVRDAAYSIFVQNNLTNEFKSNSETPIGLEKSNSFTSGYNPASIPTLYSTSATGTKSIQLSDVEKYGMSLRIIYKPNFFSDAWKIEEVSMMLEFRDTNGDLHATSVQKNIVFSNAATFLDNFDKRILICTADNYFNPLTSFVTKDFSKRW
jgi:hypothetical protein